MAPVAEMLKQFSDVMLLVCVAFGIQKLLVAIAAHRAVSAVLTVIALAWLFAVRSQRGPPGWLTKTFIVALMVQFAVPATVLLSEQIFKRALGADYEVAQGSLAPAALGNGSVAPPLPASVDKRSTLDQIKEWLEKKVPNPTVDYESLRARVEQATEHIVRLIAVFVLQTVILPLFLLWALYGVARALLRWPMASTAPRGVHT